MKHIYCLRHWGVFISSLLHLWGPEEHLKKIDLSWFLLQRIFTARKRSLGQGNMFTGVCLSTGGSTWPGTPRDQVHPQTRCTPIPGTPPWTRYTPHLWDQVPPRPGTPLPAQNMLGDTVNVRAVRIILECNLVVWYFRYSGIILDSKIYDSSRFFCWKLKL